MKHFSSIEEIREASVETLKEVPSMDQKTAESVYAFFREDKNE